MFEFQVFDSEIYRLIDVSYRIHNTTNFSTTEVRQKKMKSLLSPCLILSSITMSAAAGPRSYGKRDKNSYATGLLDQASSQCNATSVPALCFAGGSSLGSGVCIDDQEASDKGVNLGLTFTLGNNACSLNVAEIKFYAYDVNTEYYVYLYEGKSILASGSVSTSTTGWTSVPLNARISLTPGVSYTASYFVPGTASGEISSGIYAFKNERVSGACGADFSSAALVTIPGCGNCTVSIAQGAGTYTYGPVNGAFPSSTFDNTNYFVTPVISTVNPRSPRN